MSKKGRVFLERLGQTITDHIRLEYRLNANIFSQISHRGKDYINPILCTLKVRDNYFTVEPFFDSLFVHENSLSEDGKRLAQGNALEFRKVITYALQLSYGVEALQELCQQLYGKPFIHRDLKWDNIGFVRKEGQGEGRLVITDYGHGLLGTLEEGSPNIFYSPITPPEGFNGGVHNEKYDVWSLGTAIYNMATGKVLFPLPQEYTTSQTRWRGIDVKIRDDLVEEQRQKLNYLKEEGVYKIIEERVCQDLRPLLERCMVFDNSMEGNRYTIRQLIEGLEILRNTVGQ